MRSRGSLGTNLVPAISYQSSMIFSSLAALKLHARPLAGFQDMCNQLRIPLHPDKTVQPCQSLTFLGVEIDLAAQELRLPQEKLDKARSAVFELLHRRKAPLRDVQACIGLLQFACIAMPLGRVFLRRMFDLCMGVRRPFHKVAITSAARLDLRAWSTCLSHFPGRSLLYRRRWLREPGNRIRSSH